MTRTLPATPATEAGRQLLTNEQTRAGTNGETPRVAWVRQRILAIEAEAADAERIAATAREEGLREALTEELFGLGVDEDVLVRIEEAVFAVRSRLDIELSRAALAEAPARPPVLDVERLAAAMATVRRESVSPALRAEGGWTMLSEHDAPAIAAEYARLAEPRTPEASDDPA